MPLHDHFHAPRIEEAPWEAFHSAWINTIVRHLNGSLLPRRYRAFPQIHLGPFVETDLATFERVSESQPDAPAPTNGGAAACWSPPEALQTLDLELPAQDVFEVRVVDEQAGKRLVAVIELVSPGNKDRPDQRQAFIAKSASYLQEQVSLIVVDVVTSRHANLHRDLLEMFAFFDSTLETSDLYAVAYRNRKIGSKWRLDIWRAALTIGTPMPTLPLWLTPAFAVPIDLEQSYTETAHVLRID